MQSTPLRLHCLFPLSRCEALLSCLPRVAIADISPGSRESEEATTQKIALVMYKQQVGLELQVLCKGRRKARHVEVSVVGIRREFVERLEDRLLGHGFVAIRVRRCLCRCVRDLEKVENLVGAEGVEVRILLRDDGRSDVELEALEAAGGLVY